MGYFKAINYWVLGGFAGEKTAFQAIDDAQAMGLDGIELTFGDCVKADVTMEECRKIKKYAADKKIKLRTMASGFYWGCSLSSPDATERKKAVDFTKKYITAAAELGVETILVVPGAVHVAWDPSRPVVPYAEVWKNSVASIKKVLPLAEKLGVKIGLENVWNKFLLSPMEWKCYLEQFNSKNVGIYLDLANLAITGFAEHWIEILGKKIFAIHVKNFKGEDCAGGLHGFGEDIAEGDVDFNEVKTALKKIAYKGPLTAEMIPFCRLPDLVLPDMTLARKTASRLKELFK